MKNKFLALLIVSAILISSIGTAFAAEDKIITVFVDGNKIEFDVHPTSENGRTLVPMRYIFEALGAEVNWIQNENKAVATKGDITVEVTLNSNIMTRNGKEIVLDVPAKAIDGRTLVPARAVAEALDATVDWNADEFKVVISSQLPAIDEEIDKELRRIYNESFEALKVLDFEKALDYYANPEELKANLPEGDFLDIAINEYFNQMAETEGYTKEELDATMQITVPITKSIVNSYMNQFKSELTGAKFENGKYIYTAKLIIPDVENANTYLSGEAFEQKVAEANSAASLALTLASASKPMTEDEMLTLYLNIYLEQLIPVFEEIFESIPTVTATETVTFVYQDGRWCIEADDADISALNIEEYVKTFMQ